MAKTQGAQRINKPCAVGLHLSDELCTMADGLIGDLSKCHTWDGHVLCLRGFSRNTVLERLEVCLWY
jgi:hypothetical protein